MQEVCLLYRALMASVVKDAWSGEPSNTRTQAPGETRRASTAGGGGVWWREGRQNSAGRPSAAVRPESGHAGKRGHAGGAGAHSRRLGPASSGDHLPTSWPPTLRGSQSQRPSAGPPSTRSSTRAPSPSARVLDLVEGGPESGGAVVRSRELWPETEPWCAHQTFLSLPSHQLRALETCPLGQFPCLPGAGTLFSGTQRPPPPAGGTQSEAHPPPPRPAQGHVATLSALTTGVTSGCCPG